MVFQYLVYRKNLTQIDNVTQYEIIYGGYQHDMIWVDFIELISRWFLTAICALLPSDYQTYIAISITSGMIVFILFEMPFRSLVIDRLYLLSWINLTVIILATLVYQNIENVKTWNNVIMDIILLSIIVFSIIGYMLPGLIETVVLDFIDKLMGNQDIDENLRLASKSIFLIND